MVLIFNTTVSREISGTNFTCVRLSGNKIARGEAECYLPTTNNTECYLKFIPNFTPTRVTYTYIYIYI